jgi:stage V sporulation protein AD
MSNALSVVSSHNLTAERQFRYPVEYGSPKPHTATFTTTGAVSTLLCKNSGKIKIESATIGTPMDKGIKDANHMGAVMAPAAAKVIYDHLQDLKRDANYYDLILTGDLGCIGSNILKEYMQKEYNIDLIRHQDAGCMLYLESQETYAGGSGPVCLPTILYDKILTSKKYKKILIVATGSLHSPTIVNQKLSIPGIAHAISLEVM